MSSVVKGALADTSSKGGRGTADKDASSSIGGPDGVDGAGSGKGDGGWALQAGWEGQGEAEEGEEGGKGKGRRRKKWKFVDDLEERSYRWVAGVECGVVNAPSTTPSTATLLGTSVASHPHAH
jgi:hypothetical protein